MTSTERLLEILNELYKRSSIVYRVERISNDEYLVMTSWNKATPFVIRRVFISEYGVSLLNGRYVYSLEQAQETWFDMFSKYSSLTEELKEEVMYQ